MIRILFIFLFFFLGSCSFDNKTGFWTNEKNLKSEKNFENTKDLFKTKKIIKEEFNPNFKIKVPLNFNDIQSFEKNKNSFLNFNLDIKKNFPF